MWLEMSRDASHGGDGWGFAECLWSPSHKNPSGRWPFWELLLSVRKGDIVVHLRGKGSRAAFVGHSVADADGYETSERPSVPGQWSYASSFYRVPLSAFVPLVEPIALGDVLRATRDELRTYFDRNRELPRRTREHVFFVFQAGRLQCLNGAYLSELSTSLAGIVLGRTTEMAPRGTPNANPAARTGEQVRQLLARVGQGVFSDNVRANYGHHCCFPDCPVSEDALLVGAHIARWADAPQLRGSTANGLCLCLMHDRAFESGWFTLGLDGAILINEARIGTSPWGAANLKRYAGLRVRPGEIPPAPDALRQHWRRVGTGGDAVRDLPAPPPNSPNG